MTNTPAAHNDYRALFVDLMKSLRADGVNVFVVPGNYQTQRGMSWTHEGERFISVFEDPMTTFGVFVLLHEAAHHMLGHTSVATTQPNWSIEYQADKAALEALRTMTGEKHDDIEQRSKDRLRPLIQSYLNEGIWVHGEVYAGR